MTAARPLAALLVAAAGLASVDPVSSSFTSTVRPAPSTLAAAAVFPPRLLSAPAVTGEPREGSTLTATTGSWSRSPETLRVAWLRCDDGGGGCSAVGEGPTRVLGAADVGHALRARVTATNAGGSTVAESLPTATVGPAPPPVATAPPRVEGTAVVGGVLTATDGTWTGSPPLERRWLRCAASCAAIPGETDRTYQATGDDAGATLRVEVTARGVVAESAPTAPVERRTFTQVLCRHPRTGAATTADGALPDGLTFGVNFGTTATPVSSLRCTSGAGVSVATAGPATVSGIYGGALAYRGTADVQAAGATLYRHGRLGGSLAWTVNTATTAALLATPWTELCRSREGCVARGTAADPFAAENRVSVPQGPVDGFNVRLGCDASSCALAGSERVTLTGALVALRDTATPRVTTAASGGLATDAALEGDEELRFAATDAGGGLYRVRVSVDGREVAAKRVADNGGRCADADPSDLDPYEFTHRRPCAASATAALAFDTRAWPRTGRLRVHLEDAGQNTTVLVNRLLGG